MGQGGAVQAAEPGDAGQTLAAHEQSEHDQTEHGGQGMDAAVATAGVWDIRQNVG